VQQLWGFCVNGGDSALTPEEITQYLDASHMAVMATINRQGVPQLTPNWYRYDGNVLTFVTRKDRLKYLNLQRDHRMSVCIYDPPSASNYVVIYGPATVEDATTGGEEVWDRIRRVVARYVASDQVGAYIERWKTEPRVLVTVTPEHIATRQPRRG
jgi:PPOX class probable F420-dependent enzyme